MPTPHIFPWSIHGFIRSAFPEYNLYSRGTGTLIGENMVATAAHCLYHYDKERKIYVPASEVTFIAGMQGRSSYLALTNSNKFIVHPQYLNNDENFDFGVVRLKQNIGMQVGWASLIAHQDDGELEGKEVEITGFPGYQGFWNTLLNKPNYQMYTMKGPITSVKKHKVHYRIDTSGGQSGAGIGALDDENIFECYGIHVTGSKEEGNGAVRINDDNFDVIKDWLEKFGAEKDDQTSFKKSA